MTEKDDLKCCGNCIRLITESLPLLCENTLKPVLPYHVCNNWKFDLFYFNRRIVLQENYEKKN